jgi:hypothetical protein
MAILRGYAHCEICAENYILRAGVGTEKYQSHTFDCKSCGIPISVIVRANPPTAHFEPEENVIIDDSEGENAVVLNFTHSLHLTGKKFMILWHFLLYYMVPK